MNHGLQKAVGVQKAGKNRETDHKAADVQQRGHGLLKRFRQQPEYGDFRFRRPRREGGIARRALSEQQAGQQGGKRMDSVEGETQPGGAENASADRPDQKSRAGVVAEGQQMLRLILPDQALPQHVRQIGRAHGIAAAEPDHKRGRSDAGDAEELSDGTGKKASLFIIIVIVFF